MEEAAIVNTVETTLPENLPIMAIPTIASAPPEEPKQTFRPAPVFTEPVIIERPIQVREIIRNVPKQGGKTLHDFAPRSNPEARQDLGLAILASGTAFGAWSAINSSYFTVATFADNPEKAQSARQAMAIGLGVSVLLGLGMFAVYGPKAKFAAWSSGLTGLGLTALFEVKLRQSEKKLGLIRGPIFGKTPPQFPAEHKSASNIFAKSNGIGAVLDF